MLIIEETKTLHSANRVFSQVECRKKIIFFHTCNKTRKEVVGPQNHSGLLLPTKLFNDCRFHDNILFRLISHYYFAAKIKGKSVLKERDSN